ncbi:uncharacterized protein RHOBADRAFT_53195 [Rhodotorula graminis WP1]|uniref:Uncharacterized protein n=1 Tax=Rhodotorula graminis (strain WP1) TaxID=578459 RepID=A0A194S3L4_RHOGW|nr:uncharacterized protein RHOBADRAFT_53195 [Rhodotorula graminis WP1]KPV75182.1 hypothetical protein RHOBADRAFT_53195 [Rhodotorula graminis WP1]
MSSTLAQAQADLLELLASLSPNDDPYAAVATYLRDQIYPSVPYSATCQLYFLAGGLGLTAVLILVSFVIRWRKGGFWILRMQQAPRMVRPHWSISWSLLAVVMIMLFEVFIGYAIALYAKKAEKRFGYWVLVVWGIAWFGGHTAAWSLLVSYTLHLFASTGRSVTLLAAGANLFGLVVPVFYFCILIPLVVIGGNAYSAMIGEYRIALELLDAASATWSPGQQISIVSLAPALPLFERLIGQYLKFQRYFRVVFIFYTVTAVALVVVLVTVASLYLSSLRRIFKETRHDMAYISGPSSSAPQPQQVQVARTLRSLLLTIIALTSLGTVFTVVAIIAAYDPRGLASSSLRAQILILLPLYAFLAFGFACAILLVLSARDARPDDARAGTGSYSRSGRARDAGPGARSRGAYSGGGMTGSKVSERGRVGALDSADLGGNGHPSSIQLVQVLSGKAFHQQTYSHDGRGRGGGTQSAFGGVSVAVDVDVVVDGEDDVENEKVDSGYRAGI